MRTRTILVDKRGNGKDCPSPLLEREGCNLFRCPGTICEDNPDVPTMTGGVDCRVLYAMGCDRSLKDLAAENDREFPSHIPPETRVKDACPVTCGTCAECAPGCQLRDLGNRHCDEACNNIQCQMDLGDCGGDCELPPFASLQQKSISVEPPASSLAKGQSAVLSCKEQGLRFEGLYALRQVGVVCRDRDQIQLIPEGLVFPSSSASSSSPSYGGKKQLGRMPSTMLTKETLQAIPPCVPDICSWVYVEGFVSSSEEDDHAKKKHAEEEKTKGKKKNKSRGEVHVEAMNGFYYRGDAYRGYPRFVQDKFGATKFFLWMHATDNRREGERRGGGGEQEDQERRFVWRITQTDPLEGGNSHQPEAKGGRSVSAVGIGKRCLTPPLGSDGPLNCIDTWMAGGADEAEEAYEYGNTNAGTKGKTSFSGDQIS